MAVRSDKSLSFMREQEHIEVIEEEELPKRVSLNRIFEKDDNNRLVMKKQTLLKITKDIGMNRNVVVNALHLQNYSLVERKTY